MANKGREQDQTKARTRCNPVFFCRVAWWSPSRWCILYFYKPMFWPCFGSNNSEVWYVASAAKALYSPFPYWRGGKSLHYLLLSQDSWHNHKVMASSTLPTFQTEGEGGRWKPYLAPCTPTVVQEASFLQSVKDQGEVRQVPHQTAPCTLKIQFLAESIEARWIKSNHAKFFNCYN